MIPDHLNSVNVAKSLSDEIQDYYEDNFGYPIALSTNNSEILVNNFRLEQNYPNPFNPVKTSIKYVVGSQSYITLKVYDVLGNEIATLVNEELSPGEYEVEFSGHSDEGQDLTSGIYFYS